jgi:hypothetical protein
MNTLRVLARPRIWGPVLGIVAVLTLVFYAYLGASSALRRIWRICLSPW